MLMVCFKLLTFGEIHRRYRGEVGSMPAGLLQLRVPVSRAKDAQPSPSPVIQAASPVLAGELQSFPISCCCCQLNQLAEISGCVEDTKKNDISSSVFKLGNIQEQLDVERG